MFNRTRLALQLAALPMLALPLAAQTPPPAPPPYLLSNIAGNAVQNVIATGTQVAPVGFLCTFSGTNPALHTASVGGNQYDATGDFFFLFTPLDSQTRFPTAPRQSSKGHLKVPFPGVADIPTIHPRPATAITGPATFTTTTKSASSL